MANYAIDFQRTASTTLSVGTLVSAATVRRVKWYDIMFGSEATPADAAILWAVRRCTTAGTSTLVTAVSLDPGDGAALTVGGENHTIEPAYTAGLTLLNIAVNQRATFRWVAAPGGELVTPATSANGAGIDTDILSTGTPVVTATVHFQEQ